MLGWTPKNADSPEKNAESPQKNAESPEKESGNMQKVKCISQKCDFPSEKGEFWGWSMVNAIRSQIEQKIASLHDQIAFMTWPNRVINFGQIALSILIKMWSKPNEKQRF